MKTKIVLVDDNVNNLLLEEDLLLMADFEVFTAVNATDALILVKKVKPKIIILDVQLPDMSGRELAIILREDIETATIPIVFVTASVLKEDVDQLLCIDNSAFISKPINTRTFAKQVSQYIK
ncbi:MULTISPECIES: response regulator [Shewanella]|uniref:response regulator n=1 Tax=unclassified Shewanella TaxID=196818 RepID=UPI0010BF87C9|nr:response regulator [Shewanella sp. MEBiC00475]